MDKKNKWMRRRTISNIIVICAGIFLFLILSNIGIILEHLGAFVAVFSPFVGGVIIAFLLNLPMRFFERKVFKSRPPKSRRTLSILVTYLIAFVVVGLLIGLVLPQVVGSITTLISNAPAYLQDLNDALSGIGDYFGIDKEIIEGFLLNYDRILQGVLSFIGSAGGEGGTVGEILDFASRVGSGVLGGIVSFFTALIASVYMLASRDKLIIQCKRLLYAISPKRFADSVLRIGRRANGVFSGFISGKILNSAIIGAICFAFLSIMNLIATIFNLDGLRMPYSVLISVVIGVTDIIPFFGPFIGAIPCGMILLMINPWSALWFGIFILVLQQVDGNFLSPKILGDSTGLPAMWVLVAIIVGTGFFGFMGMLLGVPTAALLYSIFGDIVENRLHKKGIDKEESLIRKDAVVKDVGTSADTPKSTIDDIANNTVHNSNDDNKEL